jgi:hypothetical protein
LNSGRTRALARHRKASMLEKEWRSSFPEK